MFMVIPVPVPLKANEGDDINPKAEGQNPKEVRSPKFEVGSEAVVVTGYF
jgi:hypothetical protein